ncbi:hypothetical protein MBLNU457_g2562t1 [Dothideomycetes sp. NU457]
MERTNSPTPRPTKPTRRPSLLPAFEPLSSSPVGLPRVNKRKFNECSRDDRQYYPTPVPTSSTGILQSSPGSRHTRPFLQRSVSTLSERAPLGSVPSLDLPSNGEPVLMGRSSNSSDYQLSANRLISRVHVKATYHGPSPERADGEVVVECVGWNGCKVHYLGQVADLAKGQTFVTDGKAASIMVDVQDTRVLLLWPKKDIAYPTRSPSLEASPIKRNPAADMFASSPPSLFSRLESPVSPTPAALPANSTFAETFIAGESFSLEDDLPVKVYEDQDSADDELPREVTPTPVARSSPVVARQPSPVKVSPETAPEPNGQFEPGELSEHDEENDPIVISFGPFGDNLLAKFEGLDSASPDRERKAPTVSPLSVKSSPRSVEPSSVTRAIQESPIKNHIINQLAFSRVHSIPISQIYTNLPSEMKTIVDDKEKLRTEELKMVLDKITCVGEISRNGKDAAGKPLENEFYYIPDFDEDEPRRTAVSIGKPPLRNVRKQHKVILPATRKALLPKAVVPATEYFTNLNFTTQVNLFSFISNSLNQEFIAFPSTAALPNMPPKKKTKVAAISGPSLASSRFRGDEEEEGNSREVAMSLGYGRISATFNTKKRVYQQTITYESSAPFDLTSATISAGPFIGRQVVLLEPKAAATVPFRFLDLPAELRNMIYAEVFGQAYEIHVQKTPTQTYVFYYDSEGHRLQTPRPALEILATCKSIHDEASSMFYGSVRFHLTSTHLTRFLISIPMHTKYIRSVDLSGCSNSTRRAMSLLSGVKELDVLRIGDSYSWRGGAYYAYLLKPLLRSLQEKLNDREAVCHKILFVGDSRLTADTAGLARFDVFRDEAFTFLKDRPEPELVDDDDAVSSGPAVRRDTGRPKRSAVKAISYAEED